ncbi:MAG: hypothetical protein AABZ15_08380 [Nitrospirota bacterium]
MNKRRCMHGLFTFLLLATLIAGGCASTHGGDDPLKYTKKLVVEGHATLYNNGAFEVPNTSIKLIPPMPETTDLVMELMGMRAYQSMQTSLERAGESVTIIADGTKRSYELAKDVREIGKDAADAIDRSVSGGGKVLLYKSTDLGKQIVGRSWDTAAGLMQGQAGQTIVRESRAGGGKIVAGSAVAGERIVAGSAGAGDRMVEGSSEAGKNVTAGGAALGDKIVTGSLNAAKDLSSSSIDRSGRAFHYAGTSFVKGYAAVPANLKKRIAATGDNLQKMNPVDIVTKENEWRKEWSQKTVDLMSETVSDYGKNATSSFRKAGDEMSENYKTQGVSLSVLKSIRWVLQGILWDATIEPIAKTSGAALGYLSVNLVAFPTMVVAREGIATTQLAVQVTVDTAKTGYDIVAPTAIAAIAGVLGAADLAVSQTAAATTAVAGPVAGYAEKGVSAVAGVTVMSGGYVTGKAMEGGGYVAGKAVEGGGYVTGKAVKGGGYVAGKTVQYIAVPLASAGIVVGGGTIGTAVGVTGAVTGGTVVVAGETGSVATNVFGNVIAGTTLVAGTAVSTGGGAAYGVYQLSKAIVVPAGYELGGGIVLSYETLSQLSAQSILAVSDCAYMVLSLEGPRWVLYAVRGKLGKGEDLPAGAVLDLKKMQEQGEEIVNLPLSDEEMKKVVESVYSNLPETQAVAEGTK